MSHLYRECLCPSPRVLTLGPPACQSLQRPEICSHLHPVAIKLQSLQSVECGICRGLHCLAINTLAAPSTIALAFPSAKKALPSFLPKERHSLGTIPALLRATRVAPWWPSLEEHRSHISVATRAMSSSSSTLQLPGGLGAMGPLPTHPTRDWESTQTPSGWPGKGWGYMLSSFQCLPEKIRLKEQTKTPLSLEKRFRDNGEVWHRMSPARKGTLGDGSIRRLPGHG